MAAPVQNPKPKGLGQRHVLAITGFFGLVLSYSLRFNLSIAIVAMVDNGNRSSASTSNLTAGNMNPNPDYVCPHPDAILLSNLTSLNVTSDLEDLNLTSFSEFYQLNLTDLNNLIEDDEQAEFNWSEAEQGLILGSFFWGYMLTQIPGGWLGHRFGGKWPFGVGLLITGVLAIVTPFAAHLGGMQWLIFIRTVQGFAEGITLPAMHELLAKWVPPDERGKIAGFVYAGMPFGTAFSTIVNGYIIQYIGWPWMFYVSGMATILWFSIWAYLISSCPEEHPRIGQEELKYIQNAIQRSSEVRAESHKKTPWKKVWTTWAFWAILVAQTSENWGLYTIMTELPTYMKTVLHFDIKENSLMSAFPHLLTWVVSVLVTQLGDFLITNHYLSTSVVRKCSNTLGLWGSAAGLMGVAYAGCDRTITVTLLALAIAARGGIYGGVMVSLIDIAPNYAGVLMGVTNTVGSAPGFLAPWIAGMIIDENPSIQHWRLVFFITCGIAFVGNLLFIAVDIGKEQPWNRAGYDDDTNPSDKTVEIPSFHGGQFYTINGPLTATLPATMIITRTNDEEEDANDIGLVTFRRIPG